jgi:hypothetical protein
VCRNMVITFLPQPIHSFTISLKNASWSRLFFLTFPVGAVRVVLHLLVHPPCTINVRRMSKVHQQTKGYRILVEITRNCEIQQSVIILIILVTYIEPLIHPPRSAEKSPLLIPSLTGFHKFLSLLRSTALRTAGCYRSITSTISSHLTTFSSCHATPNDTLEDRFRLIHNIHIRDALAVPLNLPGGRRSGDAG